MKSFEKYSLFQDLLQYSAQVLDIVWFGSNILEPVILEVRHYRVVGISARNDGLDMRINSKYFRQGLLASHPSRYSQVHNKRIKRFS